MQINLMQSCFTVTHDPYRDYCCGLARLLYFCGLPNFVLRNGYPLAIGVFISLLNAYFS